MGHSTAYAVVRVHDDSYRLDRTAPPGAGAVAFVLRFRDRLGSPLGWRLRPLAVMQGAKNRICPTPAEALASTKLFSPKETKEAVQQADGAVPTESRGARS